MSVWLLLICLFVSSDSSPNRKSPFGSINAPSFWDTHGEKYVDLPEDCESTCSSEVSQVLDGFISSSSISNDLVDICSRYEDAVKCMAPLTHCSNRDFFDSFTSGVKYLCHDQREAFDALIGCIIANTDNVRKGCESQCHATEYMTGFALKDILGLINIPLVDLHRMVEPHMGSLMLSEGCRTGKCLMDCHKAKFDVTCEGTAGSLIMEALSRPLSSPSSFPFLSMFSGLLPHQCSYLMGDGLQSLRIDKQLDVDIKRMYQDRKKLAETDPLTVGKPTEMDNPFSHIEKNFTRKSILDNY
ncbi:hypothetical protein WR25_21383 [Diploscapter pachys]|uniref:Chondroitin proteoglycan 4 domain-containing protein n=1 Tax=Diploscapter pachys TaxID=2018661 RepID=A0A2A2K2V4_9BILA|nr:hypothetical protein WR25_21383 [Diploscapter pachys]